ncbi:hypothetical protein KP509_34G068600 [Ceratopteris richardii]|nr:hypothetical protein KP509_34G068600 [Ceratopteris richardii]
MQSAASTDLLFVKQGDEKGDALAIVPDSLSCALPCFSSGPAHFSPPNAKSKNINVPFTEIALSDSAQELRPSRKSAKRNLWLRINMYPVLCLRCNVCEVLPDATIIYPRICRFSSSLWPFDPGIHTVHRSPSLHRPFASDRDANSIDSPYMMLLSFLEGEYISRIN